MATVNPPRATPDDLMRTEGNAELIGGKVVQYMATGVRPNEVAGNIYVSPREHAKRVGRGKAFTNNVGYIVPELPSSRESLSPDASYDGPLPQNPMRFIEGPPKFAAEVRSENDCGPAAEVELAAKRTDYFAAGTQVVWDVDPTVELSCRCARPADSFSKERRRRCRAHPARLAHLGAGCFCLEHLPMQTISTPSLALYHV